MNTKPLRALTLWQPWAHLVAIGAKRYETRSWPTNHRGWLAIHAATKWTREIERTCDTEPFATHCEKLTKIDTGLIVAVVQVVDCVPVHIVETVMKIRIREDVAFSLEERTQAENELAFGNYEEGRWAWKLSQPLRLRRPITASGKQGMWFVTDRAAQLIRAEIAERTGA